MHATARVEPSEHRHSTTAPAIQVRGLEKRYGSTPVLHGISFAVEEGELFGLLGTNGAGKTTTVEILQGLRRADAGSVTVLGLDPARAGDRLRRRIGAQLQDAALPDRIRVGEALRIFASLHPAPRPLDELSAEWQLDHLLTASVQRVVRRRTTAPLRRVGTGRPASAGVPRRTHAEPRPGRSAADVGRRAPRSRQRHDRRVGDPRCRGGGATLRSDRRARPRSSRRRGNAGAPSSATSARRRRCRSPMRTSTCRRCAGCPESTMWCATAWKSG